MAQKEPYYKLPSERTSYIEKSVLKNVATKKHLFFAYTNAGMLINKTVNANNSNLLAIENEVETHYGFGLGFNNNYNWEINIGAQKNVYSQRGVINIVTNRGAFYFDRTEEVWCFPVAYTRRLFYLNRVSKAAYISGKLGLSYINKIEDETSSFTTRGSIRGTISPGPLDVSINKYSLAKPIMGTLGMAIEGKVFSRLELGVYYDLNVMSNALLVTEIRVKGNSEEEFMDLRTKNRSTSFGLKIKWNFETIDRYLIK